MSQYAQTEDVVLVYALSGTVAVGVLDTYREYCPPLFVPVLFTHWLVSLPFTSVHSARSGAVSKSLQMLTQLVGFMVKEAVALQQPADEAVTV